ncbi:hypothetical protein KIW84_045359 [Lathyrus oleraceus]|uniref:Retrovirus-related Pol polyprotein from transposon TNT 1-94-like beta-barrel domain-containing protein n=1 Tax=Pisum sativum TaxID=3888 RepID=A0A9D5ARM4_PEA|nr:hypothetical protein KIW84_045359 [Pisum sativum]
MNELGRLEKHESQEKKSKGIALKVDSMEDRNDGVSEEDENGMLLVKRLGKKDFKNKKAYVAWEDNDISSSSESESDECANLALMASHHSDGEEDEVCLKTTSNLWYLDSGCSKHMTGDINKFSNLALKAKGYVTYGDNNKGRILGTNKVGVPHFTSIEDVLYVEGLKQIF